MVLDGFGSGFGIDRMNTRHLCGREPGIISAQRLSDTDGLMGTSVQRPPAASPTSPTASELPQLSM